jgi:arylsulfatase A-like enzyme
MTAPNILLITSDQQHWLTLGVNNPHIKTPNLDRLARQGANFTRAYTNNPVCTPTRATLITGLYPAWHGAWTIGVKLPEDVPTIGETFQQHGYESILVGKAHFQPLASGPGADDESIEKQPTLRDLDFWRHFHEHYPSWYGFNRVETARMHTDESHVGGHYAIWMEDEKGLKNWPDYFWPYPHTPDMKRAYGAWDLPDERHHSTWVGERTNANIERCVREGKPFFLWSSYFDPHPPYAIPEPWASMYDPADMPVPALDDADEMLEKMPPPHRMTQDPDADYSEFEESGYGNHGYSYQHKDEAHRRKDMAIYYGMISKMDHEIGKTLDKLDELGIADNTLVVFTTDHGHYLGQHGLTAKGPFHYEDGIKLPFIVRWPNEVPAGVECDALQALVDLPPTFLDACGIAVPGLMQGVSQLDVWRGRADKARDEVLVENRHQPSAVHLRTYLDKRYKMTVYRDRLDWGELFDLEADPNEYHNRWDDPEYSSVKAEVMHRFINAELAREPTRMPRVWTA